MPSTRSLNHNSMTRFKQSNQLKPINHTQNKLLLSKLSRTTIAITHKSLSLPKTMTASHHHQVKTHKKDCPTHNPNNSYPYQSNPYPRPLHPVLIPNQFVVNWARPSTHVANLQLLVKMALLPRRCIVIAVLESTGCTAMLPILICPFVAIKLHHHIVIEVNPAEFHPRELRLCKCGFSLHQSLRKK